MQEGVMGQRKRWFEPLMKFVLEDPHTFPIL